MRDHALAVSGATVSGAARVDGRKDLWELTLAPSGTGAVSILVPPGRACTEAGALCTADGRTLASGLGLSVPGPAPVEPVAPALTASFASVPEAHDGERGFWVRIAFSEDVRMSYRDMRDHALAVSGATVVRAKRVDKRRDLWRVRLRPSSHEAVTVTLAPTMSCEDPGAVCTAAGLALSGTISATIAGPPGLSVADAQVEEGPNAVLAFAVTLDRAASGTVTVDYATADGTAAAGEDYTHTTGTLSFSVDETAKTVTVAVLDDAHDEGSETLTLALSNSTGAYLADGEATGTITNSDHMPQAWLARFGRTVADQVLDAVEGRMTAARAPGSELSIVGQRVGAAADPKSLEAREGEARLEALSDWLRGESAEDTARGLDSREVTARELLTGSSFALTAGSAESGFGAVWGRGAVSRFDGREGELTLDGEVESAMLGADWALGRGAAGLVLSHSRGEGGYRSPAGDGEVESTLTGLYPWGRHEVSESLSLWGVAGYGAGTLTLTPEGMPAIETDMGLAMAALGGRGVLAQAPATGGLELAATSDALVVRTTSEEVRGGAGSLAASRADVTRLRLGLEGTWRGMTAGGGTLVPSLELGVRHDGGDAETGFGADIGAGLAWSDPVRGIAAEIRARGLLTHDDGSFRESGFAGSFAWDPDPSSDLGASFNLTQTVGAQATGGMDALLQPDAVRVFEAADDDEEELRRRRLEAKLGYGLAHFGGRYTGTPSVGLGLSEAEREVVLGWRLAEARSAGLVFGLDVEAARRESASGDAGPEHRLGLGLGWRLEGKQAGDAAFELRLEGARVEAANDDPEHRVGLKVTARW